MNTKKWFAASSTAVVLAAGASVATAGTTAGAVRNPVDVDPAPVQSRMQRAVTPGDAHRPGTVPPANAPGVSPHKTASARSNNGSARAVGQ